MENFSSLFPYLILATLSGLLNTIIAWEKLHKKCCHLIFYKPLKTFMFWIWLGVQILIPSVFFWFMVIKSCPEKPSIDWQLITNVLVYGIFFQIFSDTTEKLGITPVNIIIPLNWFDEFFYQKLLAQQKTTTANFWFNLRNALQNSVNLSKGIEYLKNDYFDQRYLNPQDYEYYQTKLTEIEQEANFEKQCEMLISNCFKGVIPRQDLPDVLSQFKLENFINNHFS